MSRDDGLDLNADERLRYELVRAVFTWYAGTDPIAMADRAFRFVKGEPLDTVTIDSTVHKPAGPPAIEAAPRSEISHPKPPQANPDHAEPDGGHLADKRTPQAPARPLDDSKAKILAVLHRNGGWMAFSDIVGKVDLAEFTIRQHLRGLVDLGKVEAKGATRSRRYRAARQEPDGEDDADPQPAKKRPAAKRRFTDHAPLRPERVTGLAEDHEAVVRGRTLFPATVVDASDSPRLLVSGEHSRKIGDRVTKGAWKGFPIFTLTLEERATCPRSCFHYRSCYGNSMPRSRRHRHGADFERLLEAELADKQRQHPGGFVVRLHVLGDFYSIGYVSKWATWLDRFTALHVFGYTAHPPITNIGHAIRQLRDSNWARFAIRFSEKTPRAGGATTIWRRPGADTVPEGIVCPAQTRQTDCCGTCGLCWAGAAKDKCIVFVAHGMLGRSRRPDPTKSDRIRRNPRGNGASLTAADVKRPVLRPPQRIAAPKPPDPAGAPDWMSEAVTWLHEQGYAVVPVDGQGGLYTIMGLPGRHTPRELVRVASNLRVRRGLEPLHIPDLDPPTSPLMKSHMGDVQQRQHE